MFKKKFETVYNGINTIRDEIFELKLILKDIHIYLLNSSKPKKTVKKKTDARTRKKKV